MRALAPALLALLVLLAAPAGADCAPAVVTPEQERLLLAPGEAQALRVAIENRNDVAARAFVAAQAPSGWSVTPANPSPTLLAGGGSLTSITVAAPERGAGEARGTVVLRVTLECEADGGEANATTTLAVGVTPIRPAFLAGLAALAAVAVGGLLAARLVNRLAGVGLDTPEPERTVAPGGVASFPLLVTNRRTVPEEITLAVGPVPPGWSATPAVPELLLEPREAKEVWIAVRAPAAAGPGDEADVVVHAALKAEPRRASAVIVRARVPHG